MNIYAVKYESLMSQEKLLAKISKHREDKKKVSKKVGLYGEHDSHAFHGQLVDTIGIEPTTSTQTQILPLKHHPLIFNLLHLLFYFFFLCLIISSNSSQAKKVTKFKGQIYKKWPCKHPLEFPLLL